MTWFFVLSSDLRVAFRGTKAGMQFAKQNFKDVCSQAGPENEGKQGIRNLC